MRLGSNKGFSLVEIMVTLGLFLLLIAGVYVSLGTGRDTWATTNKQIELQQHLRKTLERIAAELSESGKNSAGVSQVNIINGGGAGTSDVLRFSIPVICETGGSVIDGNGDVANWGAALTWGCNKTCDPNDDTIGCALMCMDEDDDCLTKEYGFVHYEIDDTGFFMREVWQSVNTWDSEVVFDRNITDFQAAMSVDQNIVTLTITASDNADNNRPVSVTTTLDVLLRNRG